MKNIALILFLLLGAASIALAYSDGHTYIQGKFQSFGEKSYVVTSETGQKTNVTVKTITVDGWAYELDPDCKVIIQSKNREGIYHENKGNFRDLRTGDSVYAKKIGNTVIEISIEEWKR
jgi:hypothetical protein